MAIILIPCANPDMELARNNRNMACRFFNAGVKLRYDHVISGIISLFWHKMGIDKKKMNQLQRFCIHRERCRKEVCDKMRALKVAPSDYETYLKLLEKERFFDEKRFVKAFVHDKFRLNKWGRLKIAQQLRALQINEELIKQALCTIDENEYRDLLIQLIRRYQTGLSNKKIDEKKWRTFRYLLSKGFEPALSEEAINNLLIKREKG